MNTKETDNTPQELEGDLSETLTKVAGLLIRRRWWIMCTAVFVSLRQLRFPSRCQTATLLRPRSSPYSSVCLSATSFRRQPPIRVKLWKPWSRRCYPGRLLAIVEDLGLHPEDRQRLKPELLELVPVI